MAFNNLIMEILSPIAVITINHPPVNALNNATIRELGEAFAKLEDERSVRAVILTGSGEKAFSAGADAREFLGKSVPEMAAFARNGHDICRVMESMGKPIIAAVNGYVFAGGLEMAMACDIRFASETARFGHPELLVAMIPGIGGTQRLARLAGLGFAREFIYSGEPIPAQRAYEVGLVNKVFPAAHLMEETKKFALKLAARPTHALKMAKLAINYGYDLSLDNALMLETQCFAQCWSHPDLEEGIKAFFEKREPHYHDDQLPPRQD